jgi:hypothetical protein
MLKNILKIFLFILIIIIISILIIKRFVYFRPTSEFLPYKENYQDMSKGNIHGWFLKGKNGKAILFCHGNGGNISHRQNEIDALNDLGYSVLIFDYSGYGRSKGVPSEKQFYYDASIFATMLLKDYHKNNIIVYGESIGAPVAAYTARKYNFPILIIDSGLPSIKKYISYKSKILGLLLGFIFPEFNTELYINGYKGKILVLHSKTDEIIPYKITEFMRKLATQHIIIQGSHNDKILPWKKIDDFINQ